MCGGGRGRGMCVGVEVGGGCVWGGSGRGCVWGVGVGGECLGGVSGRGKGEGDIVSLVSRLCACVCVCV